MEPAQEKQPEETEAPRSRLERARQRAAALQAREKLLVERAQAERGRHSSVDAAFEMVDRDIEVGGGIIAGALAYRMFIWTLPFALVLVAGLGLAASAESKSPQDAAKSLGLAGLVTNSVAEAAKGSARWYALLVGIPVLFLATRSVLRVLIGAHRLVWADVRAAAPRPTVTASARLLILLLCFFVLTGLGSVVRQHSLGFGVLATVVLAVPYSGLWLLVSSRLPRRGADWRALVPGALLFGLGVELIHLVTVYFIARWSIAKQGTYGALGAAAVLLVGLFLISRLVVAAAVLNATLWERRTRES